MWTRPKLIRCCLTTIPANSLSGDNGRLCFLPPKLATREGGSARPELYQQQFGAYRAEEDREGDGEGDREGLLLDGTGISISAPKKQSPQRPSSVLSNLTCVKFENGYKSKGEKVIKSSQQT